MNTIVKLFLECASADYAVNDYVLRVIESTSFNEVHVKHSLFNCWVNPHDDLIRIATMQDFYINGMECSLSQN